MKVNALFLVLGIIFLVCGSTGLGVFFLILALLTG